MLHNHIELRQKRDLGDTISIYFDFLKQNLRSYTNIFIRYNGIFIIGFLGISYLLVTGFMGLFNGNEMDAIDSTQELESAMYLGLGGIGFVLLFLTTAILNYSLAASYIVQYEKNGTAGIDKKQLRALISNNIGNIVIFILLLILIYFAVCIAGFIVSIVPVVGTVAFYILILAFTAWMGVSFMVM